MGGLRKKRRTGRVDPETGELQEEAAAPASRRSGIAGALRRVAKDALVRRTSTKGHWPG